MVSEYDILNQAHTPSSEYVICLLSPPVRFRMLPPCIISSLQISVVWSLDDTRYNYLVSNTSSTPTTVDVRLVEPKVDRRGKQLEQIMQVNH